MSDIFHLGSVEKLHLEGVLGDNFYDFFYEGGNILVGVQPGDTLGLSVDSRSSHSLKRARVENSSSMEHGDSSTGDVGGGGHYGYGGGKSYAHNLRKVVEHDSEDESEEDQGLLIEHIVKQRQQSENNSISGTNLEEDGNRGKCDALVDVGNVFGGKNMEKLQLWLLKKIMLWKIFFDKECYVRSHG
jgi:hypothetical protein